MKHIFTLIALLGAALSSIAAADYSPMLEAGKTWKYNMYYFQAYAPGDDGTPYQYIIGEPVNVGDKQIYPLYWKWVPDSEETKQIAVYLWEDTAAKRVYQLPAEAVKVDSANFEDEILLYDFAEAFNSKSLVNNSLHGWVNHAEPTKYVSLDNKERNAWTLSYNNDSDYFLLAEGLGLIDTGESLPQGEFVTWVGLYTNLRWGMVGFPTGDGYTSALYEIVDGEGKMIYSLKEAYPHYRTGIAATGEDAIGIEVLPGAVTVSSNRPIGEVAIISTSGTVVKAVSAPSGKCEIPLDGIDPGIYILRAGKESRKIVVK